MNREKVMELRERAIKAKDRCDALGMRNVMTGRTERLMQATEYDLAKAEWYKAESELRSYLDNK